MANMLLQKGELVRDQYQILKLLSSKGSFSDVYEALDVFLNVNVILKVVHKDATSNKKRLKSEFDALYPLNHHPFVCKPLSHAFLAPDVPFFAFPVYDAIPIADALSDGCFWNPKNEWQTGRPLQIADSLRVLCQSAAALAFIHKSRVYHLDVKPDNILINKHSIVLIDFNASVSSQSDLDDIAASPSYLAPDVNLMDTSHEALVDRDLYALGITCYQCLAARTPPASRSYQKLRPHDFPVHTELTDYIEILTKLLRPSRKERFGSAEELISELRAIPLRQARSKVNGIATKFVEEIVPKAVQISTDFIDVMGYIEDGLKEEYGEQITDLGENCEFRLQLQFGQAEEHWMKLDDIFAELNGVIDASLETAKKEAEALFQKISDPETLREFQFELIRQMIFTDGETLAIERTEEAINCEDFADSRTNVAEGFYLRHFDSIYKNVREKLYQQFARHPLITKDVVSLLREEIDTLIDQTVRGHLTAVVCKNLGASFLTLYISDKQPDQANEDAEQIIVELPTDFMITRKRDAELD